MVEDQMDSKITPLSGRILWYILVGFSLYWLGNILVAFPWLINKTLGIIAMFLSTVLWAYMSFYCLRFVKDIEVFQFVITPNNPKTNDYYTINR